MSEELDPTVRYITVPIRYRNRWPGDDKPRDPDDALVGLYFQMHNDSAAADREANSKEDQAAGLALEAQSIRLRASTLRRAMEAVFKSLPTAKQDEILQISTAAPFATTPPTT